MLSAWTIRSVQDAVGYFEKDNYYTKDGGYEHSRWCGKGAEYLGLKDEIKPEDFAGVLSGQLPNGKNISTETIGRARSGEKLERRPGTDLTFSAPKSVSIAALVVGDASIFEAHKKAVSAAMKFAEENAAVCMAKDGRKNILEKTDNLLIARFDHDTARETKDAPSDPQLHSHCVVVNATKRKDGKWAVAPNELLLKQKMLLGAIYRAELAHEIQNLGYRVRRTHSDGRFEIVGISREQIEGFSHRREEVEAYMRKNGLHSGAGASIAAKNTRRKKQATEREGLREQWVERARELGINLNSAQIKDAPLDSQEVFQTRTKLHAAEEESRRAIGHISERQSVMGKYELLKVAMQRSVGYTTIDKIQAAFSKMTVSSQLIKIDRDKFTTPKLLEMEEGNLEMIRRGLDAYESLVDENAVTNEARASGLNNGQSDAVCLLSSTSRFVGVQGYAGTGKTSMLKTMNKIAEKHGLMVRGFAPTAAAAKSIETEAGIKSQTLDSFLMAERNRKAQRQIDSPKELWIVDEASMMSTQKANRLFRLAEKADARVWLVGDRRQLGSIESGGPFALATKEGMPYVEMREILRQKNETLKEAVKLSIDGKPIESLRKIGEDVIELKDRTDCLNEVVREYFNGKPGIPKDSIVITSANEDRKEINSLIRTKLIAQGTLGQDAVDLPMLTPKHLTQEETKRIWSYSPGDIVAFRRSYDSLKIKKGDVLAIDSVDTKTGTVKLKRNETKETLDWKPRKASKAKVYRPFEMTELRLNDVIRWTANEKEMDIRNGETASVRGIRPDGQVELMRSNGSPLSVDLKKFPHWDHAYCSTVYASQGKTCDRVIAHLDTTRKSLLGMEQFYVSISRARHQAKIFTNDINGLPKAIRPSRAQENAVEVRGFANALKKETSAAKNEKSHGIER